MNSSIINVKKTAIETINSGIDGIDVKNSAENNFGLRDADLRYIIKAIKTFPEIGKAVIFGSRAKGNYKYASDVDIAIFGEGVSFDVVSRLHSILENESPMPYFFDVVDYTHLEHEALKDHIDRVGKEIYKK